MSDLLFREPRSLHLSVLPMGQTLIKLGGKSGGHVIKVLVLAAPNNVSYARMEYLIRDQLSWLRFFGFDLDAPTSDAKTIRLLREKLTEGGALNMLFADFDRQLRERSYPSMGGHIAAIPDRLTSATFHSTSVAIRALLFGLNRAGENPGVALTERSAGLWVVGAAWCCSDKETTHDIYKRNTTESRKTEQGDNCRTAAQVAQWRYHR